jgi:hypothetical protein
MPVSEEQISELDQAYQFLGVPATASASTIKQAYRRMAKRWHPDLFVSGTSAHAEATRMMKLLNEAYSIIRHAPLRYRVVSYPPAWQERARQWSATKPRWSDPDAVLMNDSLEFWIRFVLGAFFGGIISLRVLTGVTYNMPTIIVIIAGFVLVGGVAAARYGDQFWHKLLGKWWLWGPWI